MKVFVVYASAGTGHFKAAEAIYNYLRDKSKNIQIELIDVLDESNILFKNIYTYGYVLAIKYAWPLWAIGFRITYGEFLRTIIKWSRFVINRLNTKRFASLLINENPDYIISTHFLSSEISAYLKRNQEINSKIITVITDFGIHPFWLSKGTDIYVVALGSSRWQLILRGVQENNIKELGIPIDAKFLRQYDKSIIFKNLRLQQDKFTVLIVTGSFGIGPIEEIVDLLHKDIQVLVVCARNRRLYERLKNKNYSNLKVFGFIDNIQELMAISNLIITKPGGLTISESLAMNLPPIFISAIPGQETENIKILAHYGIGIYLKNLTKIKNIVIDFKEHPEKLNKIKEKINKIKKSHPTEELCRVVCPGSIRATS